MKEESRKYCGMLIALCTAAYFVSYISRINYGAVLLEIVQTEGISKVDASMAVTGSFITYGAGQIISGELGDRIRPRSLIFAGLLISAGMNVLVPVFVHPGAIMVFWCINGFAQALMWPPMVRLMSDYLEDTVYKKGCVYVTWGSSLGTIVIYLLGPVCILWKGWKSLFFICAATAFLFSFVWLKGIGYVESRLSHAAETCSADAEKKAKIPRSVIWLLGIIMPAIVMQGILRDGITTWMPSYVSETFGLSSSLSILTGILLPIFGMAGLQAASFINRKLILNEMSCAAFIFLPGTAAALVLWMNPERSMGLSVLLPAVITGCMYGVNIILVSMIPPYFKKYGRVGTVSGILNSCTYVGSALSSCATAWVAENSGWKEVLFLWLLAAAAGAALCAGASGGWRRFLRSGHE